MATLNIYPDIKFGSDFDRSRIRNISRKMVLMLDGNSVYGAHLGSRLGNSSFLTHLLTSTAALDFNNFVKKMFWNIIYYKYHDFETELPNAFNKKLFYKKEYKKPNHLIKMHIINNNNSLNYSRIQIFNKKLFYQKKNTKNLIIIQKCTLIQW